MILSYTSQSGFFFFFLLVTKFGAKPLRFPDMCNQKISILNHLKYSSHQTGFFLSNANLISQGMKLWP